MNKLLFIEVEFGHMSVGQHIASSKKRKPQDKPRPITFMIDDIEKDLRKKLQECLSALCHASKLHISFPVRTVHRDFEVLFSTKSFSETFEVLLSTRYH